MNQKYITAQEAGKLLNINAKTVLSYGRSGKLTRVKDYKAFPIRQHALFYREEVEALRNQRQIKGYTVSEAAKQLNISRGMVHHFIREGQLKASKDSSSGRERYIIDKEHLNEFDENYTKTSPRTTNYYYDSKEGAYLYQPYIQTGSQLIARIMDISDTISLVDQNSESFTLEEAKRKNYKTLQPLVDKKIIQSAGKLSFSFPIPKEIDHEIYDLIDWLMKHLGYRNLHLSQDETSIHLKIQETVIETNNHSHFSHLLSKYCVSGDVISMDDGIRLKSNFYTITTQVDYELKKWIEDQSKQKNMTQKEFISSVLKQTFENEKQ
ncbi:DNA binding domain-containing protein, excisionase family [Pelagirhabdus alkalitolerans]|uniref:DNA binding domain-containing protein, excisionase family n=1 Tax=Pelagirhabdus alkalitolerans TaxID=1612202 RepID=A0A1G6MY88_9BACI|nr:helix-turn-helix domain-containing protein [Pelagirhabdus alkalitolerans]SDC60503.1 DNA binding domain-containing protein, excisionase family [Pelagirhabdus alkalitolerans]